MIHSARARTLLLYSQLLYQIHRAPLRRRSIVTTPHSRNRASSSSAPRPTSRDSPGGARERLEECCQLVRTRRTKTRRRAATAATAASERTAKRRRECVHVDRLDHRARAVRAWLEFMNKIVILNIFYDAPPFKAAADATRSSREFLELSCCSHISLYKPRCFPCSVT